ncbi:hypothetical protein C7S20_04515 [Christiangramia fulva]|uniref:Death domain-containing protein n=1 Tax=Christiangramia fulva TaxID=2126553 RepID=A0A2R3Z2V6_9FLAO|nr:hypothetical protein [Christiangramia fulva]AVR44586.1 hypothetical protein C7S20_04515 [Christiangramia fulva]
MGLITRNHLQNWADTVLSKSTLPYLISRLIRATSPKSTRAKMAWGSATYIGGWDGIVNCESDTAYVPQGVSLWELGTDLDIKGKANGEYEKRKDKPLSFEPTECVFIFVTPRLWTKKDEWIAEKKAEGIWKDVRVYDSVDIEQWLDDASSVSRWFASQNGVGASYPTDGMMTADEFWEEWSVGPNGIELLPETVIAGREIEKEKLLAILNSDPSLKAIKASTKNEAIAFIVACAKKFGDEYAQEFFSKALIVDTEGNFRSIKYNNDLNLNLIPRFEDYQPLYTAVGRGHHVLVPLGADDDFNQDTITLPTIDRDGQIKGLTQSGVEKNEAEKFSRESGRNITILKKLLGFPYNKAKWLTEQDIREVIPALLIGRWDETFKGDIELLEKLAKQPYDDYKQVLNKWKNLDESPILQIGETWRLTSPLDLWTNLASNLVMNDFQLLKECFEMAFKSGNPIANPKNDDFASRFNQKRKFSAWSRQGLTQSLILIARLGDSVSINIGNPQGWVDSIIQDLVKDATGELWISLDRDLPLISEASPNSFLKAIKASLEKDEPEIMDLFQEEEGFLHKTSHHTGLLWALESLAWFPAYLKDASLILLILARLDPGGHLSNRPINSIVEIYKPWHHQTLASIDERIQILKEVTIQEKQKGWNLLIRLLPNSHGVGQFTHKMRWRMFDMNTNLTRTYQEIWDTHTAVVKMLIELFDNDEKKFAQVLKATTELSPKDRKRVLDWAEEVHQVVKQEEFTTWETLRNILYRHRSHSDTKWALPEEELKRYERLYHKLQPEDVVKQNSWLFNNHHLEFPEGCKYEKRDGVNRYALKQNQDDEARKQAVEELIDSLGVEEALALRNDLKEFWIFGDAFARVNLTEDDVLSVCSSLEDEDPYIRFSHGFMYRKSVLEGFDWVKSLFNKLKEESFSHKVLSNVLIPLDQNMQLWNFISEQDKEVQDLYWCSVYPRFLHATEDEVEYGLNQLLSYKRFFSAIDVAYLRPEKVKSELLIEILEKAVTQEADEKARFKGHEIERIFEELDKRDIDRPKLIQLEWYYLALMDSYGSNRNPKNLEDELATNPSFFIDVLKWLYLPKDQELLEKEKEDISDEVFRSRGKQSYHLLHSWKKIPGLQEDNTIDKEVLWDWIKKARELAVDVERLKVADSEIGKLLAQYPENVPEWPNETIFEVIESINSDSIKQNYSSGMFNKRSFTSRGAFDGGDIERERASYFRKLSDDFKFKYPNVAQIFENMARSYLLEAERQDEEAERRRLEY